MDTNKSIVRQQAVMKTLGFYAGKLDGIWGPKTIEAKRKWETSNSFAPAVPNQGMPFNMKGMLPAGTKFDSDGCMSCEGVNKVMDQASKEIKEARIAANEAKSEFVQSFGPGNAPANSDDGGTLPPQAAPVAPV